MTRPTRRTLGLALIALLATAPGLRAGVITAIDPGAGPTSSLSVSSAQLQLFQTEVNTGSEILVNFGGISATNAPTADGKWFSVNAAGTVQVETSGTDHGTPPSGFQYGVAVSSNTTDKAFNNPTVGFNISGDQRFEFVPKLNASASSVTFRSSTPFQAFGFYLTGLGDQTGTLTLTFPGGSPQVIPGATGGGAEFVQYVGDGSPISQFTLTMTGLPAGRRDVFGIDDIRFAALSVPEPSALALAAATVGLGVAGFFARKRLGRPRHG